MANTEGGFVRVTTQQALGVLLALLLGAAGWIWQGERQRIDRLETTVQTVIPGDINTIRTEIAGVKSDIAVLRAQGAASQVTLDRIDRRIEALAGGRQ